MSIVEDLLLSWERERAGEKTLTASVLQAWGKWTEKVTTVKGVVVDLRTGQRTDIRQGILGHATNYACSNRVAVGVAKSAILILYPRVLYVLG